MMVRGEVVDRQGTCLSLLRIWTYPHPPTPHPPAPPPPPYSAAEQHTQHTQAVSSSNIEPHHPRPFRPAQPPPSAPAPGRANSSQRGKGGGGCHRSVREAHRSGRSPVEWSSLLRPPAGPLDHLIAPPRDCAHSGTSHAGRGALEPAPQPPQRAPQSLSTHARGVGGTACSSRPLLRRRCQPSQPASSRDSKVDEISPYELCGCGARAAASY